MYAVPLYNKQNDLRKMFARVCPLLCVDSADLFRFNLNRKKDGAKLRTDRFRQVHRVAMTIESDFRVGFNARLVKGSLCPSYD